MHWNLAAVGAHLAGYAVRRRVDGTGIISLYNRNHHVGIIHQRKTVYVMFDPVVREWIFADEEGRQLGSSLESPCSVRTAAGSALPSGVGSVLPPRHNVSDWSLPNRSPTL
jgi:hypothetical protein